MDFFTRLFGSPVPSVNAQEANQKLSAKARPFLLDVRQPDEFRGGHINGAKLIPLGELRERMKELPKNREILVVCASGSRSVSATRQLATAGFNAINVTGGMSAWMRAGLPVKR
jgi:rhodanese-related sulfurtransferase